MENVYDGPIWEGTFTGDMTKHVEDFIALSIASTGPSQYSMCYFGILACACKLESLLEEHVGAWCAKATHGEKELNARILGKIRMDISRTTGLDPWKSWFKVLFDIDLAKTISTQWEAIDVLFKVRNQLAHGRTTKFRRFWRSDGKYVGMTISGSSYGKPLMYLLKKNIVVVDDREGPSAETLLTPKVVQFFSCAVDAAIAELDRLPALKGIQRPQLDTGDGGQSNESEDGDPRDIVAKVK